MLKVKICGVRTVEEARQVAAAGADAVGLNFHPRSPRYVSPRQAEEIVGALPPFVTAVGLFVDAPDAWVRLVADRCRLGALQFHGPCSRATGFGRPVIRALSVRGPESLGAIGRLVFDALLLDGYAEDLAGGTGRRFDWSLVGEARRHAGGRPIVLAGGLTPETVAEAVRAACPDAVDVASGVESAPGVKDPALVARFIAEAKGAPSSAAAGGAGGAEVRPPTRALAQPAKPASQAPPREAGGRAVPRERREGGA